MSIRITTGLMILLLVVFSSAIVASENQIQNNIQQVNSVNNIGKPIKDNPVVVLSGKDWTDNFLLNYYAAKKGYDFLTFKNLADAELKTSTITQNRKIIAFESNNPVVKNYEKYLEVNGYKNYEVITYDDLEELQEIILNKIKPKKFIILSTDYSLEAISANPLMINNDYFPLFLNEKTKKQVFKAISNADEIIIAGHFPVRLIKGIKADDSLTNFPDENALELMKESFSQSKSEWAYMVRPDQLDLSVLRTNLPVLVYFGDIKAISEIVKNNNIIKFEIIGGKMVDVAKAVEANSEKDLKMLLRYGRTFGNAKSLEGKIFDIDYVEFPYPFTYLQLKKIIYYENMGVLAISFENKGNIPLKLYNNIEFMGKSLSDNNLHVINPGNEITIPYYFGKPENNNKNHDLKVIINSKYDYKTPLRNSLRGDDDKPIVIEKAIKSNDYDNPSFDIIRAEFDDNNGRLLFLVKNNDDKPLHVMMELDVNGNILSSNKELIEPFDKLVIKIPTPFLWGNDLYGLTNITVYYGTPDTIHTDVREIMITEKKSFSLIGNVILSSANNVLLVLLVIAIILLMIYKNKRKKKTNNN